ncbi:DMT family transporter [Terriglobus roseus]|uniref:Permease of the drug/metabolite transporter (DMT) superfamily n=1 Tax=Terriglobus roseus TaxID=392734 RepID=A0A1H4TFL6_9BACT|nr:DMT family transporter [Terriglobus roseus]SEC55235.1 Permease of the drug/metabolite transporter (DMT) superfamily [Terriglobus roseus]
MTGTTRRQSVLAHLLLLATVAVWGGTFGVVKGALRDASPLLFNQLRMILAFVALAILHAREWPRMGRDAIKAGVVAGFFLAAGYELQTAGLVYTTPDRSAFLTGLVVVLVPLCSVVPRLHAPGASKPRATALLGATGAFAGIVLLTTPAGMPLREFTRGVNRGDVLSLLCAVAFAGHLLSLAHLARRIPTAQLATLQIGFAAVFMSIATPAIEHTYLHWTTSLVFALVVCALLATAAAFSIQSWAQQHLQASHTALLLALEPAFALLTALLFFGERLTLRSASGAALIFCSLVASELLSGAVSEQPEGNLILEGQSEER